MAKNLLVLTSQDAAFVLQRQRPWSEVPALRGLLDNIVASPTAALAHLPELLAAKPGSLAEVQEVYPCLTACHESDSWSPLANLAGEKLTYVIDDEYDLMRHRLATGFQWKQWPLLMAPETTWELARTFPTVWLEPPAQPGDVATYSIALLQHPDEAKFPFGTLWLVRSRLPSSTQRTLPVNAEPIREIVGLIVEQGSDDEIPTFAQVVAGRSRVYLGWIR